MLDIIGVGDTNVDVMIRVPHIASHDEKVRGQLLGNFPGGIIGNFCCAAAAFGAKAGAVCKVGMDGYGELAKSDLQRRGVDIRDQGFGNVGGSDHARADRCYLKGFLGVVAQGDARSVVDRESDERRRDVVIANNAQIVAMRLNIKI